VALGDVPAALRLSGLGRYMLGEGGLLPGFAALPGFDPDTSKKPEAMQVGPSLAPGSAVISCGLCRA
jgi:hypothetical protein